MKKIIYVFALFTSVMNAQVGIGTTNPTAKLEIDASIDAIPALEIVPRTTAPTGTASGQISIMDGSLYVYDATRAKWLSSETMVFPFGKNGSVIAGDYLQYARVEHQNSGAKVLQNATIVGIAAEASGGNPTKGFDIIIKTGGTTTTVSTTSFSLTGSTYLNPTANINLSAGDYISIQTRGGTDVNNPTVTLYVKWRK